MKTLSVGQIMTRFGHQCVISAIHLTDGKISYTVLGLETPTLSTVLEKTLFHSGLGGVLALSEVRSRCGVVQDIIAQREADQLRVEQKRRDTEERERNMSENADLLTVDSESNTTKLAAKNIRILLKKHFHGVKFSVRTQDYTCINVSWTDGATQDAVDAVINKFKEGHFDSMADMYEYSTTAFNRLYGGVKYLFCQRSFSNELLADVIEQLRKEHGERVVPTTVTVEAYRKGALYYEGREYFAKGLQTKIWGKAEALDKTKS